MKLTKLQRHTAYIIMLSEYETGPYPLRFNGFCWMIKELFMDQTDEDNWERNTRFFQELKAKKPKVLETSYGSWFWCNEEGTKKRINILKQCIEETY